MTSVGEVEANPSALEVMEWARPQFKKGEVDWAGRALVAEMRSDFLSEKDYSRALEIITNWRSAHAYPLNTFQVTLRRKAKQVDTNAVVAQRTKRLWSIWHKLDRFNTMQLTQMQDIGGCRAILATAQQASELLLNYQQSSLRHPTRRVTNYISKPRESGYRGIHVIWEYRSDKMSTEVFNGLRIEMQIRSVLQHAWATTVETIGTLTNQALKSSLGNADWLRFFALMGSVIAIREQTEPVPGTFSDVSVLLFELRVYAEKVHAAHRLRSMASAISTVEQSSARNSEAHFFLLVLNPEGLEVTGFRANQQKEAQVAYSETERRIGKAENSDAVLVSVDSIASLKRAYPNYFLDTHVFAGVLDEALKGHIAGPLPSDLDR